MTQLQQLNRALSSESPSYGWFGNRYIHTSLHIQQHILCNEKKQVKKILKNSIIWVMLQILTMQAAGIYLMVFLPSKEYILILLFYSI